MECLIAKQELCIIPKVLKKHRALDLNMQQ